VVAVEAAETIVEELSMKLLSNNNSMKLTQALFHRVEEKVDRVLEGELIVVLFPMNDKQAARRKRRMS
jgi:ribosomal 50S subunit-associated protein YjgA (DUF615 family)